VQAHNVALGTDELGVFEVLGLNPWPHLYA
jgi:hypothetical protein